MRTSVVVLTLFAFGCAEQRYAARTEMVEVAPDPALSAQAMPAAPAPSPRVPSTTGSRGQGFIIGGTIASLAGVALILGGAIGLQRQQDANAAADAQCEAQQGWFCGLGDNFSTVPYAGLIGFGALATAGGIVLIGVGVSRRAASASER